MSEFDKWWNENKGDIIQFQTIDVAAEFIWKAALNFVLDKYSQYYSEQYIEDDIVCGIIKNELRNRPRNIKL